MSAAAMRNLIGGLILTACLGIVPIVGYAQVGTPKLVDSASSSQSPFGIKSPAYLSSIGPQTGTLFAETLRAGGQFGYMLSHGGIVPGSLRVSVGAQSLKENVDFTVDPANGMLSLMTPVRRLDSVRVSYRYVDSADTGRSPIGLLGMALNFNGTSLNFGYGISKDTAKGLDFTTYGLGLNSKLGAGSTLNGLVYISTPASTRNNLVDDLSTSREKSAKKVDPKDAVTDHLLVQDVHLKSGAATFRASYQDVGQHFSGFQSLRASNAKNTDLLTQLNALEKEKGIKRMGFGGGLALSKSSNLGIDWDRIGDDKDAIVTQGLKFNSGKLNFNYSTRSIGRNFARFADLREADKAQWAKEKGFKRTDLTLGFAVSKGSQFSFNQGSVGDKAGELSRQAMSFSSKNATFLFSSREAAKGFTRINDLSDAEKTALALDIRRQFNPNAAAGEVTAKDKEQIALDAGLKRNQIALSSGLGKGSALTFNQFGIRDDKGGIDRQTIQLTDKRFSFNYLNQNISDQFGRLGKLSEFEKTQFANERGIHRTAMGLNLMFGKKSGALGFTQLSLADKTAGMLRRGISYDSKGFELKLNMASTDRAFARANDLAMPEPERKAIEAERGFRRTDFTAKLTSIRGLALDAYNYNAKNDTDSLAKKLFRYNLAWSPVKNDTLNYLTEGNSLEKSGKVFDGSRHDLLTYSHRFAREMGFQFVHDALNVTAGGVVKPAVVKDLLHFELFRSKPSNLLTEWKRIDLGGGRFEATNTLDMNYLAAKALGLHFNTVLIDRGNEPSSTTESVDFKYKVGKDINVTGLVAQTKTEDRKDVSAHQIGINGPVTKSLTVAVARTMSTQRGMNTKIANDIAISNTKPVNLLGVKKLVMVARYTGLNDQGKKQNEVVGGRLQGMLGANMFGMDYGGAVDPKGVGAVCRTLTFTSDPNPKLPFHVDMLYKSRNINHGALNLVRKYNASMRIDKKTTATYTYASLPEDAAQNLVMTKTSAFALKRSFNKTLNLAVDYTTGKDLAKKTAISKMAVAATGKLDQLASVQVGYSVDINRQTGKNSDAHTFTLGYDRQLDADHAIRLGTTYVMYRSSQPDDLQANIDFRTKF